MSRRWGYRLRRTFFGLTDEYIEAIYEQFFALMYHGNWDFQQAYSLPVGLRTWFVQRLVKEKEAEREAVENASSRSGKTHHSIPSNLPI